MKTHAIIGIAAATVLASGALLVKSVFAGNKRAEDLSLVTVAWTPPKTTIDENYVSAAQQLLGNGLADPRNGRFSKVQITLGDAAWGRLDVHEAYGWVSPDGHRVVLLDGVEYPVTGQVSPADLETALAEQPNRRRMPNGIEVSPSSPALPALLLLVGRVDLAEQIYQIRLGHSGTGSAWSLFDHMRQRYQMLCAQSLMSRKDIEGLSWSKWLVKVGAVRENFPNLQEGRHGQVYPTPPSSKANADFAHSLYEDFQRRVDHPKKEPVDLQGILKLDVPKRAEALVAALDTVEARQMGQPGGIDYLSDPVCKAVSEQGKDIVRPLIDAIDSDKRFTRSISYGRDFGAERSIHSVKYIAWNLLTFVWPSASTMRLQDADIPAPKDLLAAWDQQKGLTEEERWLSVLRNDGAGERQWLEAAQYLVKPVGEIQHGFVTYSSPNPTSAMTGESLRATHNSEVIRLMSSRAIQMATGRTRNGMDSFVRADALALAHCLAKWDLKSSTDCLKKVCEQNLEMTTEGDMGRSNAERMGSNFGLAIVDRVKTNDKTAASDYEKLLEAMDPTQGFQTIEFLRPLWSAKNDPGIQAVGERLCRQWTTDLSSANGRLAGSIAQSTTELLPSTPLLDVGYYRRYLIAGLLNESQIGTLQMMPGSGSKRVNYRLSSGGGSNWNVFSDENPAVLEGKEKPMSVSDYFAQKLANGFVKGVPEFHILWPEDRRHLAKAAIAAWFRDDRRDWTAIAKTSGFYRMFE